VTERGRPGTRAAPAAPAHAVTRAAAVVGGATLASRVLGFARDVVVAGAFGAGPVTDAFFVAFRIPNLLRRLLAEGALSSAFVPVFTEYLTTREPADFRRMLRAVAGAVTLALAAVTLAGAALAPLLVWLTAPGFFADPGTGALTVTLTRLMFPYLFFVGLAALAMGVLNARGRFLAPALSPVALNVAIISAVLLLASRLPVPVVALAVGVLAGGAGQLAMQLPALARAGALVAPGPPRHPAVGRILRLMAPVAIGQSAAQLGVLVNTIVASFLAGGSVSYLYYADRLVEFPLGVFGIAVATAVLPTLSAQAARGEVAALRDTLAFAQRLGAFVSVPAAVGLLVLREPIVRVLYERGQFGPAQTRGTAVALGFFALALVGWTSSKIGTQAFYALGDTRTPVKVSLAALAVNSALAAALAWPLGHGGLALATAVAATVQATALAWLLRRRLGRPAGADGRAAWWRTGGLSAALGLALAAATALRPAGLGRAAEAAWLLGLIAGGGGLYVLAQVALGADEARELARAARRRAPATSSLP
jgi:putative peptidoglycan lipid II flippase